MHNRRSRTVPLSTDKAASLVIGQASLTTSTAATTSTGLTQPFGLAFDSGHDLWVADFANSRVLQLGGPASVASSTTTVSSTTATSPTSTTSQSSTTTQTSASSSTSGGGVPEFPYQFAIATAFTVPPAASYLLVRSKKPF